MPKLLILVLLLSSLACQPSHRSHRSVSAPSTWLVVPVALAQAPVWQPEPQPNESYRFFLKLVRSGIELPHALVRQHTLIAQPYGQFEGVEIRALNPDLHLIVLRQTDEECIRHFLLTGSRFKTIDQVLFEENCPQEAPTTQLGMTYRFRGEREVEQLEVLDPKSATRGKVEQAFGWTAEGRIHRLTQDQ